MLFTLRYDKLYRNHASRNTGKHDFLFLFVWEIAVKLEEIQIFGLTDGKH